MRHSVMLTPPLGSSFASKSLMASWLAAAAVVGCSFVIAPPGGHRGGGPTPDRDIFGWRWTGQKRVLAKTKDTTTDNRKTKRRRLAGQPAPHDISRRRMTSADVTVAAPR